MLSCALLVSTLPCLLYSVSGFDHSSLDALQQGWHTHLFPYKIGAYRKKILTDPLCIGTLKYAGDGLGTSGVSIESAVKLSAVRAGRCDCFVLWVDFLISDGNLLQFWDGFDFPSHLKTSVKFLENPQCVEPSGTQESDKCGEFSCNVAFSYGESTFNVDIHPLSAHS